MRSRMREENLEPGRMVGVEGDALVPAPSEAMTPSRSKSSLWKLFPVSVAGRGMGIGVISKPQHFNGTSTGCLITTPMEVDPLLKLQYQIRPFAHGRKPR